MNIWILDSDVDSFENLMPNEERDSEILRSFNGEKKQGDWIPLSVKRMYGNRAFSNCPGLSPHVPVFDEKAVGILKNLLKNEVEILPLKSDDGIFYAINVTEVLDCIDYENSDYKTFRDRKRIMRFTKYSFNADILKGHCIFKIKDEPLKRPFVSDEFKAVVMKNGLTGFKFELAWDSESTQRGFL